MLMFTTWQTFENTSFCPCLQSTTSPYAPFTRENVFTLAAIYEGMKNIEAKVFGMEFSLAYTWANCISCNA